MQVDLRPVEGALALAVHVLEPLRGQRLAELLLGEVPLLVRPQLVVGAKRELDPDFELEQVVEVVRVVEARKQLVLDLLVRAVDVRVVLDEVAHAQEPVQHPGQLVPVEVPGLREPSGSSR